MPLVPCTGVFLGPSKSGKTVADQHDSGAIPRSLQENLYLQSVHQYRRRLDPQEVHRGGPGEYRTGEGLLRRVGRGSAAYIIQRQRKITETSKKLEMKKLYQVLRRELRKHSKNKRSCPMCNWRQCEKSRSAPARV